MTDWNVDSLFARCHTVPEAGCWLWPGSWSTQGYGRLKAKIDDKWKMVIASRAMFAAVHGYVPKGYFVCHKCDTPACVNPDHLFLGTLRDNVEDMVRKGRSRKAKGEVNSNCKLTEEQVMAVLDDPRTSRAIANEYGVATSTIGSIRAGMTWGHLTRRRKVS